MKNEYIEVVKRWQAGEVFSVESLKTNSEAAEDAYEAALVDADAARFAADITRTAADAVQATWWADEVSTTVSSAECARADAAEWTAKVERLMGRYEKLTNG